MSRIGNEPITVPEKVSAEITGREIVWKGPKGTIRTPLPKGISCKEDAGVLSFSRDGDAGPMRAAHGLARALAANACAGVVSGFERKLEIVGVGFRAAMEGKTMKLNLGYSHEVSYVAREGVEIGVEGTNKLVVRGVDKQAVGQTAAELRALRSPDPYKGKGVRYAGERIKLKAGKSGAR